MDQIFHHLTNFAVNTWGDWSLKFYFFNILIFPFLVNLLVASRILRRK